MPDYSGLPIGFPAVPATLTELYNKSNNIRYCFGQAMIQMYPGAGAVRNLSNLFFMGKPAQQHMYTFFSHLCKTILLCTLDSEDDPGPGHIYYVKPGTSNVPLTLDYLESVLGPAPFSGDLVTIVLSSVRMQGSAYFINWMYSAYSYFQKIYMSIPDISYPDWDFIDNRCKVIPLNVDRYSAVTNLIPPETPAEEWARCWVEAVADESPDEVFTSVARWIQYYNDGDPDTFTLLNAHFEVMLPNLADYHGTFVSRTLYYTYQCTAGYTGSPVSGLIALGACEIDQEMAAGEQGVDISESFDCITFAAGQVVTVDIPTPPATTPFSFPASEDPDITGFRRERIFIGYLGFTLVWNIDTV